MPYVQIQEVLRIWPKLHTSGFSHEEIESVEERVRSRIDAALAYRYKVPFAVSPAVTPPIIKTLTIEGIVIDIMNRAPNTPDWVTGMTLQFQETLRQLAAGEMLVTTTTGETVDLLVSSRPQSTTSDYTPTFGVEPSYSEAVDSDRVEAEDDARD